MFELRELRQPWPALVVALVADALLGEPDWLYRQVPHPVVLIGGVVSRLERRLLRPDAPAVAKRRAGVLLLGLVVGAAIAAGALLAGIARLLPAGWIAEGLLISTLLAQRSLVQHVGAVAQALRAGLAQGRRAVAKIVGRDPDRLDVDAVGRAAVESLAENLSDGVVAPLFWAAVAGLPGILAYKAVNTLDSMVGHRSERYRDFGWASARFDDLVNLVPARLTGAPAVPGRRRARCARPPPCCATRRGTARPTPAGPRPPWPPPCACGWPARASMPAAPSTMAGWATAAPRSRPPTSTVRSRSPGESGGCCSAPS